jgi:hypothetical protein
MNLNDSSVYQIKCRHLTVNDDGTCVSCGHTTELTTTPTIEGPKYDEDKLRYDLVPPQAIKALAETLTIGAIKYAPNSWQIVPDAERRYTAAMMRHFEAYRSGEEFDPETKLSHLAHCIANISFLLYFQSERIKEQA